MNYYCLIAGLPDIEIEDNKLTFSIADFRKEVRPLLSAEDVRLMDLFYTKFDNQNLLRYLKNKEAKFDERGNITKEELEEDLKLIDEDGNLKSKYVPAYFMAFVEAYRDAQQADTEEGKWENRLTELYYQHATKCGNKLITDWFRFNLNFNNILTAYTSRKYQMDVEIVGDNEVAQSIKTSTQRDFGLAGIIDDFDIFQRLAEETDLYEREKKIDLLKWQWLDEQTFFKYFSIELIFVYLVKLEIIERWVSLDPEEGGKIFRSLINSLKKSVVNHSV
jgi:hypothetical protein